MIRKLAIGGLAVLLLGGCAATKTIELEHRIDVIKPIHPSLPRGMSLQNLTFKVITRPIAIGLLYAHGTLSQDIAVKMLMDGGDVPSEEKALALLKAEKTAAAENKNFAYYGVTPRGYESLTLNNAEIKRYITQLQLIIAFYRKDLDAPDKAVNESLKGTTIPIYTVDGELVGSVSTGN